MKKKTTSKLMLKKSTVTHLNQNVQEKVKGGGPILLSIPCTGVTCLCGVTKGKCDLPTVGHDDGSYCLSKSDWGWCWCHGQ
jgi:hypothetical protein